MKSIKRRNLKFLVSKCLLAGILLFSFIAIAGYSGSSNSIFRQAGQTELLYLSNTHAANKTVLYSRSLLPKKQTPFHSHCDNLISLLIHNKLVKVKLDSHLKKSCSISIPKRLFPINNIPQNSAEEILSAFKS
jgi:hypothetical protein